MPMIDYGFAVVFVALGTIGLGRAMDGGREDRRESFNWGVAALVFATLALTVAHYRK